MDSDVTIIDDAPTRIGSVSADFASLDADATPAACAPPASSTAKPRRRRWVTPVALSVAFVFGMGVDSLARRRAREGAPLPAAPPAAVVVAPAPNAAPPRDPAPAVPPAVSGPPASPVGRTARPGPAGAGGSVTKARLAADAFATGDYARALPIYEELAAKEPSTVAYAHAVEVLRVWAAPVAGRDRPSLRSP